MRLDLTLIEGPYLNDLLDQPRALEQTWHGLRASPALEDIAARLHSGEFRRIVLTGMGSSFHALHPLNLQLIADGHTAIMVETSELLHYQNSFFQPETLIVAVSQSGRSAEVVRLLDMNGGRAAIIALTNTPGSPLAVRSSAAILTSAGKEFSVSCKTYVAALMALQWLGEVLVKTSLGSGSDALSGVSSAVGAYFADWKSHVEQMCGRLSRVRHLFLVGRGRSLAAVGTGALIVKESDRFHAEGMSSAAFRHGPFEMLNDETFVLIFAGDARTRDLNQRLLEDILEEQGAADLVSEDSESGAFRLPQGSDPVSPILEILPVQIITLALAALTGREPGRFELASKVTTTE